MKKLRVILAAVLVLVLCLSLCGCGAESVAEKYLKANLQQQLGQNAVYAKSDKYEIVTREEANKEKYGKIKIKTDVERVIELDEDKVNALVEMLSEELDSDHYKLSDFVKTKNIKKAACVKVSYKLSGDKVDDLEDDGEISKDGEAYITLVKEGGSWKVVAPYDIMGVFEGDADEDEE